MHRLLTAGWKARTILLILVVLAVGVGWVEHNRFLIWYYLHQMERGDDGDIEGWVTRIVALDQAAVPGLLGELRRVRPSLSPGVERSLAALIQSWGAGDSRAGALVVQTAKEFASYGAPGKCAALGATGPLMDDLGKDSPPALVMGLVALIRQATRDEEPSVRGAGLAVAEKCTSGAPTDLRQACLELARVGLKDPLAENRARAVRVAAQPGSGLSAQVVLGLRDPDADVRREAILAVGSWEDTISTEDLLPWLHDADARVRRACEQVLRDSRKLKEHHLELGRRVTDGRAAVRVQVLPLLQQSPDLDQVVWLRRLSHDASPAVRAATIRAVTEQRFAELAERVSQMSQNDPSPSVRQIAHFYLENARQY